MSTSETLMVSNLPEAPDRPKRSRFAGERLGAWLFAASFSVGMWGLALKVLSTSHPVTRAASSNARYAVLAPSDAADGHAVVVWAYPSEPLYGDPFADGVPGMPLTPPSDPGQHPN